MDKVLGLNVIKMIESPLKAAFLFKPSIVESITKSNKVNGSVNFLLEETLCLISFFNLIREIKKLFQCIDI